MAKQFTRDFNVKWFGIDGRPLEGPPSEPDVEQTDLVDALESVAVRVRGQGARAVLLISDGQDTAARPNFLTLDEYPLPVFALGFGQHGNKENSFDLVLASASAPERARVHNSVPIKVLIKKDGGPA